MQIPDYILKAVYSHYRRIVENAQVRPDDHRTADALRLARRDLRDLKKYIDKTKDNV